MTGSTCSDRKHIALSQWFSFVVVPLQLIGPSPFPPCQAIHMLMGALALHVPTGTPGLLRGQGDPEDPSGPRRRPPANPRAAGGHPAGIVL